MPKFIDLFAGCGGLSLGLRSAGWNSVAEVEIDAWACETLRHNFPESRIIESDIRDLSEDQILSLGEIDLIVGGPPCQGFSVAGSKQFGIDDPRNELFRWFLRWVRLLRPKIAIIENVPNILSQNTNTGPILKAIEHELCPIGYRIQAKILNACDYGVPQSRRRAFIVMTMGEGEFSFPSATHGKQSDEPELFQTLAPHITVGEALLDLPELAAGEGTDTPVPYSKPPTSQYQKSSRGTELEVSNHVAMKHTGRLIERFKIIRPGQSLKDVPEAFGQIANHTGTIVKKPFKYNNYRLDPDKPSLAIPASFQSLFLHPKSNRNLTAREAARLMGFPDWFVFRGKRTAMSWEKGLSQYNQIGNAVCPPVARALGLSSKEFVERFSYQPQVNDIQDFVNIEGELKRSSPPPKLSAALPTHIVEKLRACVGTWEVNGAFRQEKNRPIPLEALPLALILANASDCPICSIDMAPHQNHDGEFCFLISKDDNASLISNHQDHGLDYHLRVSLGINYQIGHSVGELLAELRMVALVNLQNPRTGRNVRGMKVLEQGKVCSELSENVLNTLKSLCSDTVDKEQKSIPA